MKASLLITLLLAACATTPLDAEADLAAVLEAALPAGTRVIVLAGGLPETVRRVAARKMDAIDPAAVPRTPTESLPAGYFILEKLAIDADSAVLEGLLGPVPIAEPGEILMACGTRRSVFLARDESGAWEVTRVTVTAC
jgi:hypothetical protein